MAQENHLLSVPWFSPSQDKTSACFQMHWAEEMVLETYTCLCNCSAEYMINTSGQWMEGGCFLHFGSPKDLVPISAILKLRSWYEDNEDYLFFWHLYGCFEVQMRSTVQKFSCLHHFLPPGVLRVAIRSIGGRKEARESVKRGLFLV